MEIKTPSNPWWLTGVIENKEQNPLNDGCYEMNNFFAVVVFEENRNHDLGLFRDYISSFLK